MGPSTDTLAKPWPASLAGIAVELSDGGFHMLPADILKAPAYAYSRLVPGGFIWMHPDPGKWPTARDVARGWRFAAYHGSGRVRAVVIDAEGTVLWYSLRAIYTGREMG